MQRASKSLQNSCRFCDCLRRTSLISNEITPRTHISTSRNGRIRQFSSSKVLTSALPVFDFLHPPVVREAVKYAKRFDGTVRRYSDDANDDDDNELPVKFPEGWSKSELQRQEELFQEEYQGQQTESMEDESLNQEEQDQLSPEDAAEGIFKELDAIHPTSESSKTNTISSTGEVVHGVVESRIVPHLR